jgi:hypothetical protein
MAVPVTVSVGPQLAFAGRPWDEVLAVLQSRYQALGYEKWPIQPLHLPLYSRWIVHTVYQNQPKKSIAENFKKRPKNTLLGVLQGSISPPGRE